MGAVIISRGGGIKPFGTFLIYLESFGTNLNNFEPLWTILNSFLPYCNFASYGILYHSSIMNKRISHFEIFFSIYDVLPLLLNFIEGILYNRA